MGKRHTEEDKKLMVSLYVNGKSVQEICEKNQISRSALYNWIKLYTERKAPKTGTIISGHRIVCLEEENRKLREENEILKKASCGCNASRSEKIQAVQKLICKTIKAIIFKSNLCDFQSLFLFHFLKQNFVQKKHIIHLQ